MKFLRTFEFYILEKYKGRVGEVVPSGAMRSWIIGNHLKRIPADAIREILSWDKIYKSKYSFSFYSKPKSWTHTENGTIRISDHWNYMTSSGKKLHGRTVQSDIGQNAWAKGVWDDKIKKYNIVERYSPSDPDEYDKIKSEYKNIESRSSRKPSDEVIEFYRFLTNQVESGNVIYDDGVIKGRVIKFKSMYFDIEVGNDKIRVEEYWKKNYKLTISGVEYTRDELSDKMGKSKPYIKLESYAAYHSI